MRKIGQLCRVASLPHPFSRHTTTETSYIQFNQFKTIANCKIRLEENRENRNERKHVQTRKRSQAFRTPSLQHRHPHSHTHTHTPTLVLYTLPQIINNSCYNRNARHQSSKISRYACVCVCSNL